MESTMDRNGPRQPPSAPTCGEGGPPLLYRLEVAADLLSIGRSKLYELIAAGEVPTVKIGRSTRVPAESLEAYVERLRTTAGAHRAAS